MTEPKGPRPYHRGRKYIFVSTARGGPFFVPAPSEGERSLNTGAKARSLTARRAFDQLSDQAFEASFQHWLKHERHLS